MKQLTTYNRAAAYLNTIFDLLNARYFESALSRPIITIQSTPKAYGHYTLYDAWSVDGDKGMREINIGAGTLSRPIENVVATLLHEMCHLYAIENGIKDTSENRFYHNEAFRNIAESHGLVVAKEPRYGFSVTSLSPDAFIVASNVFNAVSPVFHIPKRDENTSSGRKPSSTRKFKCPSCGMKIRVTKAGSVNVICGDCGAKFVEFD